MLGSWSTCFHFVGKGEEKQARTEPPRGAVRRVLRILLERGGGWAQRSRQTKSLRPEQWRSLGESSPRARQVALPRQHPTQGSTEGKDALVPTSHPHPRATVGTAGY